MIAFTNPAYSRNTVHRIAKVEQRRPVAGSSSEAFADLNRDREDDPVSETQFDNLLALRYARSDSRTGTQFFSGKLVRERLLHAHRRTNFGQPIRYTVDSTAGMAAGDEFEIRDVQAGDIHHPRAGPH